MNNKNFDRLGIAVCRSCQQHHHHHHHHWHLIPIEFGERVSNCALFSFLFSTFHLQCKCKAWEHEVVFVHQKRNSDCGTKREKEEEENREIWTEDRLFKKCIFLYAFKYYTDVVNRSTVFFLFCSSIFNLIVLFSIILYVPNKPYNYVFIGHTTLQQFLFEMHAVWWFNKKKIKTICNANCNKRRLNCMFVLALQSTCIGCPLIIQ